MDAKVVKVTAYKDRDGKVHETKESAEEANMYSVYLEFDKMMYDEVGGDKLSSMLAMLISYKITSKAALQKFADFVEEKEKDT